MKSYKQTQVHWGKSQASICKLLSLLGVQDVRFTMLESRNEIICEFNYPTRMENKDVLLGVRIVVPIPKDAKNMDQAKNQLHRALFYYLKTKFEALNFGLVEFVQEFMPHLVIFDKSGKSGTLYQMIGEKVKKGYVSGSQGGNMLLEDMRK